MALFFYYNNKLRIHKKILCIFFFHRYYIHTPIIAWEKKSEMKHLYLYTTTLIFFILLIIKFRKTFILQHKYKREAPRILLKKNLEISPVFTFRTK